MVYGTYSYSTIIPINPIAQHQPGGGSSNGHQSHRQQGRRWARRCLRDMGRKRGELVKIAGKWMFIPLKMG